MEVSKMFRNWCDDTHVNMEWKDGECVLTAPEGKVFGKDGYKTVSIWNTQELAMCLLGLRFGSYEPFDEKVFTKRNVSYGNYATVDKDHVVKIWKCKPHVVNGKWEGSAISGKEEQGREILGEYDNSYWDRKILERKEKVVEIGFHGVARIKEEAWMKFLQKGYGTEKDALKAYLEKLGSEMKGTNLKEEFRIFGD